MLQRTPELLAKYPHRWIDGSGVVVRTSREINFSEHAAIVKEFRTHGSHIGEFGPGKINDLTYCVYDVDVLAVQERFTATDSKLDRDDLLLSAWGLIANAHEGNWDLATCQWREAATRWRDDWHALKEPHGGDQTTPEDDKYRYKYERNGLMIHSDVTLWTWGFEQIEREYGRRGSHEGLIDISAPMINYRVYAVKNETAPDAETMQKLLIELGQIAQEAAESISSAMRVAFPDANR